MRIFFITIALASLCITQLRAQNGPPPGMSAGCALPQVSALVRRVFGPYAAAYHKSGVIPEAESANGKIRVMPQGEVTCVFTRNAGPPSELLFVITRVYYKPEDAATAFQNVMPLYKTFRHVGTVQLAETNGKITGYQNDSLGEVWWAVRSGSRLIPNPNVPGARLEPIMTALIGGH